MCHFYPYAGGPDPVRTAGDLAKPNSDRTTVTATENGRILHPPAGGQIARDGDVTLYLQHGKPGEPMRTEAVITAITAAPANPYLSGYGIKISTAYMVRHANRWHRVYQRRTAPQSAGYYYIETRDGQVRVTPY